MSPRLPSSSYTRLYEEADEPSTQTGESGLPGGDLCPLYHALRLTEQHYGEGEPIGTGGMKEVLRVYDERTKRHVALAHPRQDLTIEKYDAFLREAHITARLEHPNIIKLFDMGVDDQGRPFFTMEFKRGLSLRKILATLRAGKGLRDYPHEKRLSIFLRVCEAMSYAHSRHVLHLDIKPENIQVGLFGEVQVCDWGMGEIEKGDSELHLSESLLDPDLYGGQLEPSIKGTPGYMPPEQKDPKAPKTVQNDIYALGCLLYELSTLRSTSHRVGHPPASPAIAAIISKACAADPDKRYANVEKMRVDVHRHLMGYSSEAEQAGFFREARLFYQRNKLPCLITLLVIGTSVWFTQQLRGSYRQTTEALERTEVALGETDRARRLAEEALARHRLEREYATTALHESRGGSPLDRALFLIHSLMVKEGINLPVIENALLEIDRALAENPPKTDRIWSLKAHVLFMTQRFEEAEAYYAINTHDQAALRAMIPHFAPRVGENGLLPVEDFKDLLTRLSTTPKSRSPLMEKMVIYDALKRNSPIDTAEIVRAMLELSNPDWEDAVFDYQPDTGHLRISGRGLRNLYRPEARRSEKLVPVRSLLRLLDLRSLDLRGSEIADLWHLEGLQVQQLDIRRIPAHDLSPLAGMNGLRELLVAPGQFSPSQLAGLPRTILVTQIP